MYGFLDVINGNVVMINIEIKYKFEEKKNWVMFFGKMCFIFINCNVLFFDNILIR